MTSPAGQEDTHLGRRARRHPHPASRRQRVGTITQEDTPSSAAAQTSRVHSARGTPASSAAALIRATNLSCSSRSASKR